MINYLNVSDFNEVSEVFISLQEIVDNFSADDHILRNLSVSP